MISRFLLFLSVVFLGIGQIWGQTTVTGQFSDFGFNNAETSPSGDLDSNISFTTESNNSSNEPTYYNSGSAIRFYPGEGNGGSITLHVEGDAIISSVKFFSSQTQPVVYSIDGGANLSLSASSTYEITGINASSTIKFINANTNTSGSGNQLRLTGVEVTYTMATSCEPSDLTFANPTATADLADGTFTQTASSLNETTAITYESSDETVATVNPSTGEVSLLGLGTTTITANQEAGTHNATDYCAGTATYELTVISTEPVITVSTNSLSLTAFAGGASATEDITINGANLTGDIALSLTGDTNFSINPTSLSSTGGEVTITYTPSATPATHSAALTVSNGSLSEVIALSGTTNEAPAIGCFEEDFDEITTGGYYSSGTSGTEWSGNANFPTVERAYQAGGAVRLGTGSYKGSITSVPLTDYVGQNVTVSFSSKAWGTASTSILVSFGTQSQVVSLPAASNWSNGLSDYEIAFENIEANAELKFESNSTSERRFFIDNVAVCINGPSIPTPTLTTSVNELTDFVYGLGSGPSDAQSFALSGINLDGSEDITILAGDGFEISLDDVDYFEEETLSAYDGTATDIYVRLKAGLTVGNYSDIILIGGYGTDAEVSLSGEVTAPIGSYFRSQDDGNWTNNATWESSADGTNWWPASTYPDESATDVEIQVDHKVTLNSAGIKIANTEVYGQLEIVGHDFQLMGTGYALEIKNGAELILDGSGKPTSASIGTALIETGGNFKVVSFSGSDNLVSNYLQVGNSINKFKFEHHSIFEWANTNTLGSSGFDEIFDVVNPGDFVIFRMTETFSGSNYGSGTNNSFNAILEIPGDRLLKLQGNGNKTFRGGIQGTGVLTVVTTGSGKLIFGDTFGNPTLGNTGSLTLNVPHTVLQLQNIEVPSSAQVKIESSGTGNPNTLSRIGGNLDISGELDITDMRIVNTADGGITVKDGGTLRTRYTGGLFGSGSAIVDATKFTMETGSTIDYYATEDQTISTGKEYYHLILSGGGIKTSSDVVNVHTAGSVTITGNPVVDFTGHNLASTSTNTTSFTMDGGRLILGKGGTQPNMRGTYNLSGGVIEFANSSASGQTIRSTNAYSYQNIEVTGNSVGTSGGNLVLNENGTFVVKPNGIFTININSIVGPEGNQTIEIEGNGTFRTGNADGFSGGDGTSNPGQTTSIRNNIENIILHPNSTVEYSRSGDQTITDGIVTTQNDAHYQNLRISGSGVKTAASGNLIVNEITYVDAATLRVSETNDDVAPNVLTARKGIQVVSGATALFENNANLMQDPGAVNSGKVSMLRKANVPSNQYNYWSSPVSGQNLYEIYNVPNNRVMIYNTDDDYFTIKPNPHQPEFGIGYSIKGPVTNKPQTPSGGIEVVANFIGTPRNESLTISENRIPLSDVGNHYNLIGNPFPSNLDLIALYNDSDNNTKFFDDGTEDTPTVYFWDNVSNTQMTQQGSNYNQSNYALLNLSSGIGTAAPCNSATCSGGSGKKPNGIVKPGQGFIIRAAEDADHLTLKNDMRTTLIKRSSDDDEAVYFKTGNLSAEHNGERPRNDKFWVELVTADDLHIQTAVGYFTQAENSFERFDSKVMNENASDNIYTLSEDDVKLSIQGRKGNFSNEDIIPLGVRFFKYGIHKIQLEETKGIFKEHQDIYVKDKYLNITHNLSANGPYLIDAQAGEFNDRFEIVFKPSLSSTVNPASPLNSLKIEKRDHQIEISSSVEKITEVEIFNLSGWSVYKAEQVNENILKIPASQFGKEIIFVNVQTESGKTETKKIINK